MTTLFVRHRVQDYARWREVYDSVAAIQSQAGVIAQSVYRADGEPADVTITSDFASLEAARSFAESPALRSAMARAGVLGVPTIWFAAKV